ncbi:hypothetical protein LA76x_3552 [Lysobacter antibioticus]|uniref:Uncharacterized protein n=1 Tax=Lysobacter antibioticus TaxID=84531 RepID=A0A0S2FDS6_LYSAN|nr:hypothetical protein LA76x_3552 [Lysobacter antibioticus]
MSPREQTDDGGRMMGCESLDCESRGIRGGCMAGCRPGRGTA